jgi:aldehyde:ferredoxin oxidoreductase
MGAKKLLALAVRGTGTVPLADPEAFLEITRRVHEKVLQHPMAKEFRRAGTMGGYAWSDASGDLPTKNWRSNSWGKGEAIFRHFMEENLVASKGCYRGCTLQSDGVSRSHRVRSPRPSTMVESMNPWRPSPPS